MGLGANHASVGPDAPTPDDACSTYATHRLALSTEFHAAAERLPDEDRVAFGPLFYQRLSQSEAAELLGGHERTVKRRWQSARLRLNDALGGRLPGS